MSNEQWLLARKPQQGMPMPEDFLWQQVDLPEPKSGQALTRTLYLSMDPYQWVRRRGGVELPGSVCHGRTVAQVVASQTPDYAVGDYVFCTNGWQSHGLVGQDVDVFGYMFPRKLDPNHAPLSTALGVLGMLGLTAYAGLIVQCDPQEGETVVVSAASGGVGQVVGQLAKLRGARVVGIAGAQKKCDYVVNELGFDACVSHLDEDLDGCLAKACPDGCDVYFENVGGPVFAAVLPLLNVRARISLCGVISQYANSAGGNFRKAWQAQGQAVFEQKDVAVHDLFVGNFVKDYQQRFLEEMGGHIVAGSVRYKEDQWQGLASAPEAFTAMLMGKNFGKTLVRVDDE